MALGFRLVFIASLVEFLHFFYFFEVGLDLLLAQLVTLGVFLRFDDPCRLVRNYVPLLLVGVVHGTALDAGVRNVHGSILQVLQVRHVLALVSHKV